MVIGRIACAAVAVALAGCADQPVGTRTLAIENNTPTEATSYPEAVLLRMRRNQRYTDRYRCTGTLISPSTVLTAEHCIKGSDLVRIDGVYGENRNVVGFSTSSELHDDASSQPDAGAHDIALVCIGGRFPIKNPPIVVGVGQIGVKAMNLGRNNNGDITDQIWTSPSFVLTKSPTHFLFGTFKFDYGGPEYLQGSDSGGPVVPATGAHIVLAVNSGGVPCGFLKRCVLVSKVDDISAWIQAGITACDNGTGLKDPSSTLPTLTALPPPTDCRTAVVQARKEEHHHHPTWTDAQVSFAPKPLGFLLPAEIDVTSGSAGKGLLTFAYINQEVITSCRYLGDDTSYRFEACTDGSVAGSLVFADDLTVHVDEGHPSKGPIQVDLTVQEVANCGPSLDAGAPADLASPPDLESLPDFASLPDFTLPPPPDFASPPDFNRRVGDFGF